MAGSQFLNLPDVGNFAYLASWFAELGLVYTYPDLNAWAQLTRTDVTAWEASALRAMTLAYQHESARAVDLEASAPYYEDNRTEDERRADVVAKFKALAKRKGAKK